MGPTQKLTAPGSMNSVRLSGRRARGSGEEKREGKGGLTREPLQNLVYFQAHSVRGCLDVIIIPITIISSSGDSITREGETYLDEIGGHASLRVGEVDLEDAVLGVGGGRLRVPVVLLELGQEVVRQLLREQDHLPNIPLITATVVINIIMTIMSNIVNDFMSEIRWILTLTLSHKTRSEDGLG